MQQQVPSYTDNRKEILSLALAPPQDLTLLDLDDVVITSAQYTCGAMDFYNFLIKNKNVLSVSQIMDVAYTCNNKTNLNPVSTELINDFSNAANDIPVLGLTARPPDFAQRTIEQIKSVGMNFSQDFNHCPFIKGGIIFVGHNPDTGSSNDKGKALGDLISSNCFGNVDRVLFIDDTHKNIQQVEEALKVPPYDKISFTGIHYTEVTTKFLQECPNCDPHDIREYQYGCFEETGYFPSNQEYLLHKTGELFDHHICPQKCPL